MSRKKLTLSVEERLTRRAKAIAKKRGTSVSRLVETLFSALEQEEEDTVEVEQLRQRREEKSPEGSDDSSLADYKPSEWARRWRGAFAKAGEVYPDDPAWEEKVLTEEIKKKHAS